MRTLREEIDAVAGRADDAVGNLRRYWVDTRAAWRIVIESAAPADGGGPDAESGIYTDTLERRRELAGRADDYRQSYLAASVVQQLHSALDGFLLDLTRAWLLAHPRHLLRRGRGGASRRVTFEAVVDAPDRAALIAAVVEREVRDRAYDTLARQLEFLGSLFSSDRPTPEERAALAEFKATRDLLVHGGGTVGDDYLAAAGPLARFSAGERMQLPDVYLVASLDSIGTVCGGVADAARRKAGPAPARG